jgi:Flp pilus assembly protein TadD
MARFLLEVPLYLKPNDGNVHRELGIARARRGEKSRAAVELQEALRLTPDDADARRELRQLQ